MVWFTMFRRVGPKAHHSNNIDFPSIVCSASLLIYIEARNLCDLDLFNLVVLTVRFMVWDAADVENREIVHI